MNRRSVKKKLPSDSITPSFNPTDATDVPTTPPTTGTLFNPISQTPTPGTTICEALLPPNNPFLQTNQPYPASLL